MFMAEVTKAAKHAIPSWWFVKSLSR